MATSETQQQSPMHAEPRKEHQWLRRLVGEWTYETEVPAEPGRPAEKWTGTESVRSLGGLWVLAEAQGQMPGGGAAAMITTLGFDPQKGRYVGTWIGSMMNYLWVYDGELDAAERVLTLSAEGPDMATEGKMAKYRDVVELVSDDHRVLTSHMLGDDGQWHQLMKIDF